MGNHKDLPYDRCNRCRGGSKNTANRTLTYCRGIFCAPVVECGPSVPDTLTRE